VPLQSAAPGTEGISATAPRALVSPPAESAHASGEAHEDVARTLFNGNEEINFEDIASLHICPLSQEPPFQGVHFDIPDTSGHITEQVFEWSQLYWWIATPGNLNARRNVCHPLNQQFLSRSVAWGFVRPACEELQALLHREQVALDLPLEDENPLTDEDRSQYAEIMRSLVDRFVFLLFSLPFIFDCIFSHLHYSFIFDRLIDRSEVIAGDSSDDSDSVIEMFAIPPLAWQQVQRQQERPSLTSTTNTNRSTSTSNTSQSASIANASTANTSEGTTTNAA